jgi:hypothetical protein
MLIIPELVESQKKKKMRKEKGHDEEEMDTESGKSGEIDEKR